MSTNIEKSFVRGFIKFLNKKASESSSSDNTETIEVAVQCLENCFDLSNESASSENKSDPLNDIDLYELFVSTYVNVSPERKTEAEELKNEGNRLMKEEKYQEALVTYGRAIALDATNPVFYCNRAAAFSRMGDYQKAVDDCKMAILYDSNYGKAYGRLGLAYSKMNRHVEAIDAYKNALRIEPDNIDYRNNMDVTQQRLEEQETAPQAPNVSGLPNFGGLGADGQDIDLAAAFNNPALVNMATRMMFEPSVQQMLGQFNGRNNVDSLLEAGRRLAMQMSSENPELFQSIRRQMETQTGAGGNSEGSEPNPNPNNNTENNQDQSKN